MAQRITKAQMDLLTGKRHDSRVEEVHLPGVYRIPARDVTAVTFHCGDTQIARALARKGYLETDGVRLSGGKRRAILTQAALDLISEAAS